MCHNYKVLLQLYCSTSYLHYSVFCKEDKKYNDKSEALQRRSVQYIAGLEQKVAKGDSKAAYLLSKQLAKKQEYIGIILLSFDMRASRGKGRYLLIYRGPDFYYRNK